MVKGKNKEESNPSYFSSDFLLEELPREVTVLPVGVKDTLPSRGILFFKGGEKCAI